MARIERRRVDGILLLDKPAGLSSNAALQRARYLLRAKKGGHTGSLDPLATGLLPLCLGEATKVSAFLLDADKRYRTTLQLGATTTTGDREGEILEEHRFDSIEPADIEQVLPQFRGDILQVPPMYSALKHQGQRLYQLARAGVEVERPPRAVTIHELTFIALHPGGLLELDVLCSKGTYIRSLAEDIGQALGVGAHVDALRRTGLGPFDAERMWTLEQLEALAEEGPAALDQALLPIDAALADWPEVRLGKDVAFYFQQGQAVFVPKAPAADWVRVYAPGGVFLGVARIQSDGRVAPKRLMVQARNISEKTVG